MTQEIQDGGRFEFTSENKKKATEILARYPEGRQASGVIPLLDLAQRQNGNWLSREAIEYVAEYLDMAAMRVWEVATFYTMFNLKPVGRNLLQLCRTTPCWLRGSDDLEHVCRSKLGIGPGETTEDKNFTLVEVECLGACVNAPVVQINDHYYEDLDAASFERILDRLAKGEEVPYGTQIDRLNSAPVGGSSTLRHVNASAGKES
jgi:NADH-quinone oxidoreductase E subunit